MQRRRGLGNLLVTVEFFECLAQAIDLGDQARVVAGEPVEFFGARRRGGAADGWGTRGVDAGRALPVMEQPDTADE